MLEYDKYGNVTGCRVNKHYKKKKKPIIPFGYFLWFNSITYDRDNHFIYDLRYVDPDKINWLSNRVSSYWSKHYSNWHQDNQRTLEIRLPVDDKYKTKHLGKGITLHWC